MQKLNERIYNLQDLANYGLHNFKDEVLNEFNNILFMTIQTVKIEVYRTIKTLFTGLNY
jgi:hypothetical protein